MTPGRFVTVKAPIGRGWERSGEIDRLDAYRFDVNGKWIRDEISIYAASPPPVGNEANVIAEGFLSRTERGTYRLSVKSARLIQYEGALTVLNPTRWNRAISRRLRRLSTQSPRGVALAEALALGRSDRLPNDIRESYRRGGTYHLLVFSGMQIAIAAGFFVGIFRMLGRPRLGDYSLLTLAAIAPSFAGNEPSVSRAAWMIGLYALSRILHRPTSIENLIFVSALFRLLVYPNELTDPGFALTYGATGGLILIGKPLAALFDARRKLLRDVAYGAGAELATTPLTLLFFHQYVIGSSLVTILLSPVLLAMLALSFAASILCFASTSLVLVTLRAVAFLDAIAVSVNDFVATTLRLSGLAVAPPLSLVVASFSIAVALHATRARRRIAFVAIVLAVAAPLVFTGVESLRSTEIRWPTIDMLDVGQGDAILVRDGRAAILIDGGGKLSNPSFGRSVLVPLLLDRRVKRLDAVALTHPDPDHCGGLAAVMENFPVDQLWVSTRHFNHDCTKTLLAIASRNSTWIRLTNYTKSMTVGTMRVEPISARLRFKRSPSNNSSVVFRIALGARRFLVTGDIEKDAERVLAEEQAAGLDADILKVAHHGSRSSSTGAFVDAVTPKIALISCGRQNPFGHPHESVVATLRDRGARIWRTDRHGSIRVEMEGAIRVYPER